MSENEKKVREWISLYGRHGTQTGPLGRAFDALLAEHRAEVSAARDAALEEAANIAHEEHRASGSLGSQMRTLKIEKRIRALKSQPARRFLDAEMVREVLTRLMRSPVDGWSGCTRHIAVFLGLDLDAAHASEGKAASNDSLGTCSECGHPAHRTQCERIIPNSSGIACKCERRPTCPICGTAHFIREPCPCP